MEETKQLIVRRFSKAQKTYDQNAIAQKEIGVRLINDIKQYVNPEFYPESILEIGCGTGLLTRMILSEFAPDIIHLNDISGEFASCFSDLKQKKNYYFFTEDAEQLNLQQKYDLIISSSAFQWFNHLPLFLEKVKKHLTDKGILAFSTFGPENMIEIKKLTGKGLCYLKKEEIENCLKKNFQIIYSEENYIKLQMESPFKILQHIKRTGVNAIIQSRWTSSEIRNFENEYRNQFSIGTQVQLTYHPIYFIVKKS